VGSIAAPDDDKVGLLFLKPFQLFGAIFLVEFDDLGMVKTHPTQRVPHTVHTVCADASRTGVDE
jgi:hypothetical protein